MQQQTFREKNKGIVKTWVKRALALLEGKQKVYANNALSREALRAMLLMAKMKSLADEGDIGFASYFIDKDDRYYFVTNLKEFQND